MSLAVFDPVANYPGLGWSVTKSPRFTTKIQTNTVGKESRVSNWAYPVWHWLLHFDLARDDRSIAANVAPTSPNDELRNLIGFFLQRRGAWEAFALRDPSDEKITTQVIATGTAVPASHTDYPVVRSYGGFVEPVGAINTLTTVRVNGSTVSATPNVPYDGWIRLASAPAAGATVDVTCTYYWKVRGPDEQQWEQFMRDFWSNRQIELVSQKQ